MIHSATCSNIPVYIDIEYTCNQSVFLWNMSMLYMYHINILYLIWLILIEFSVYTYFISFSVFYIGQATTVSAEVKPVLEKSIKFLYMQAGIAQAEENDNDKIDYRFNYMYRRSGFNSNWTPCVQFITRYLAHLYQW